MRRRSEPGTINLRQSSNFLKGLHHTYRKCWSKDKLFMMKFFYCDEIEIRLHFHRYLSTFWNIFGVHCTEGLFMGIGKRWFKIIYVVKSKVTQPQTKYKTWNFHNFIRKKLLRDIHWKQKQIGIWKWYILGLIISTIIQLNSLFVLFSIQQNPQRSNLMSDKDLNLFDDALLNVPICALSKKSVPLFPEVTIKIYAPGTIANSQKTAT